MHQRRSRTFVAIRDRWINCVNGSTIGIILVPFEVSWAKGLIIGPCSRPKNLRAGFKKPGPVGMNVYRAVLISGPPGIGKTTSAHLAANLAGFTVLELNASDTRSKNLLNVRQDRVERLSCPNASLTVQDRLHSSLQSIRRRWTSGITEQFVSVC
jgi:hypothetical protein